MPSITQQQRTASTQRTSQSTATSATPKPATTAQTTQAKPAGWTSAKPDLAKSVKTALTHPQGRSTFAELVENQLSDPAKDFYFAWDPSDAKPMQWTLRAAEMGDDSYKVNVSGTKLTILSEMSGFEGTANIAGIKPEQLTAAISAALAKLDEAARPKTKASAAFETLFTKVKPNKITEGELTKLMAQAEKDIKAAADPRDAARMYTARFAKMGTDGLAAKAGTLEMAGWSFENTADVALIEKGAATLKASSTQLVRANPTLRTIDFTSLKLADQGDSFLMSIKDTAGKELLSTDPRAKLLQKLLGQQYKSISFGFMDEG
ncbi:MAG: hypothetical protein JNG84_08590 [Archangium sp.]|nr:hypothetical protein [Archangium sp.]